MSVYNDKEEHLRLAVDSICNQTYDNIEFIIIDDASNNECKSLLNSLLEKWNNIKLLHNPENLGLTASLNRGLSEAHGEYIARMDADDFSTPDRIAKQVDFMEKRKDVDICGTGVISFGETQIFMSQHSGLDNKKAQCMLFFSSTLCHPSVMMRKSFLDKYGLTYDETVRKGQDYDMWERCSVHGKLAVMNEVLLYYRTHKAQISSQNRDEQEYSANNVRLRRLERLGIKPSDREWECHMALMKNYKSDVVQLEVKLWIQKLLEANKSVCLVDTKAFQKDLNSRYLMFCMRNNELSILFNITYWGTLLNIVCSRVIMNFKLLLYKQRINNYVDHVEA